MVNQEETAWQEVKHKKQKSDVKEKAAKSPVSLVPADWSVPALQSIVFLRSGEPGVCQASTAAGKQALKDLTSSAPLALVPPGRLCEASKELCVKATDSEGKVQVRQRFLTQIGTGEVVHKGKQQAGVAQTKTSVIPDTVRMVLTADSSHMTSQNWQTFNAKPQKTSRSWLLQGGGASEVVDVFPPTRVVGKETQI